jgi:hypothetical protein
MAGGRLLDRVAPVVAGVAGLGWFWAELAPQREGFQDTDDPAISLRFLAAHPDAWTQAGVFLGIAAFALLVTVLGRRRNLVSSGARDAESESIAPSVVGVLGVLAVALLLGMAIVRLGGGPLLYVRGLDEAWGESAYLVTQFVGVHLMAIGGLLLLPLWIVAYSWLAVRRGSVPAALGWLALVPLLRLIIPALGWAGIDLDGLWPIYMVAIPAAWVWLILLGLVGSQKGTREPSLDAA